MRDPLLDRDIGWCRAARRLCRLLRIERAGGFDRRPAGAIERILKRRGAVIATLIAGAPRPPAASTALREALAELSGEVQCSRDAAEARIAALQAELEWRRGAAPPRLRGRTGGRIIGRG